MKNVVNNSTNSITEILIVEDSLTQANQLEHLLENNHYKVSVAKNGKQAMDKLSMHRPSLVISDIVMPEINGYELCKKIKSNKNTQDIPVILLTILSDPEEIIEGLSCGADSFITKPYNENHLLSNIEKMLSSENVNDYKKVPFGVQILFNGEKRTIQAEQQNVIKLMLNIYEGAIHQNNKLVQTQEDLRLLNEQLEEVVEQRTSALREEMNLSNHIAESLRESEGKFRKIFEDHVAVKLLIDPDSGEIIDANKAAANYYGWSREEFKGMKMDKINTLTFKEIKKEMGKAVSQTKTHFEFRHRLKDRSIRDVEVFSGKIKIRNKDVLHYIVHDITDRKKAEETIRILASFPSENPDPVLRVDSKGKLLYANEASYKLLTWKLKPGSKVPGALHKAVVKVLGTSHKEVIDEEHKHLLFSFNIVPVIEAGYVNIYGHDITERKLAEEALRESEDKFRYIFDHSVDGKSITFPSGEIQVNRSFCDMLGYSEKEMVQVKWQDISHPDDTEMTEKELQMMIGGKKDSTRIIKRYFHRNGSVIWADVSTALRRNNDGTPLYFMTSVIDITNRKLAELALIESESMLMEAQQIAYLGTFQWNLVTGLWKNSPILDTIFGIDDKYVRSLEGWVNIVHPEWQKIMNDYVTKDVVGKRQKFDKVYQIIRQNDGAIRWVHGKGALEFDNSGNPAKLKGTITDITERKLIEEALMESEERFRSMANSIPQLAWVARADGYIYWYNDRWYEYTGTRPEQMEGWGWQIVHDPEILPKVMEKWTGSIASGQPFEMSFPLRGGNGKFRTFLTRVEPWRDLEGKVLQWFGTSTDVETLKQAEEKIRLLNDELEQRVSERTSSLEASNKELEAFSYSVSHDLRAPLRAVHSYTNILVEEYQNVLDDEGKRICGIISSSATQMGGLIDDLLNFSRIGRSSLNTGLLDMKSLVVNVITVLTNGMGKEKTDIKIEKLQTAGGDANLIKQVWNNLISNAIKYTSKEKNPEIKIGSSSENGMVTYFVKDNGVGFDMQYKNKLFGVFQRLHSDKDFEGNGVGLAIVQRIILKHGGKVWAEGEVDKGATFYFSLPANDEEKRQMTDDKRLTTQDER